MKKTHRSSFQASASSNKARLMEKSAFIFHSPMEKLKKGCKEELGECKESAEGAGSQGRSDNASCPRAFNYCAQETKQACYYLFGVGIGFHVFYRASVSMCFTGVCLGSPWARRDDSC